MKIVKIVLRGFKQFDYFTLNCKEKNILVGPNNAGKSTALDALRIVSDVVRYSKRNNPVRASQGEHGVCATFSLPASSLCVPIDAVTRNYSDEPARIEVKIENGNTLSVSIDAERGCIAFLTTDGKIPETTTTFKAAFPIDLIIAPTLGPFEASEKMLSDAYVKASENTRIAHRHFRNILHRKSKEEFTAFAELVNATWPTAEIERPTVYGIGGNLTLMFKEARIPKEVHWSGFGFQVWLQMLLQITRGNKNSIIVLDEPDIYLHPDLQRKLLNVVSQKFQQIFIATHSTEIINEANSGDIVTINSKYKSGRRIGSDDDYRDLYRYIGSSENAQFSRVARAKRIVFFEGKDARLLRKFSDKISSSKILSDPDTLILEAGGFNQWQKIVNTGWTLNKMFGLDARIVALFDRDYRSSGEVEDFVKKITDQGVLCKVLQRKEIENYCLNKDSLTRVIVKRVADRGGSISVEGARKLVEECLEELKVDASSKLISMQVSYERIENSAIDPSTLTKKAMLDFEDRWSTLEGKLALVPGKEFVSLLSGKLQLTFGSSVTYTQLVSEMTKSEVSVELVGILDEFERHLAESPRQ
jgi:energy-coupling factor transporter ATP-binding protein EcfA2